MADARQPGPDRTTSRILVGVAYDETGENAMRMAVDIASWHASAVLHVAHVLPESALATRSSDMAQHARLLAQHPERLAEFARPFLREPRPTVAVHVRIGDPAEVLLQLALDYDADMLVVGTHGRRGLERLALGSVAQALVTARRCPVVIAAPHQFDGMDKTVLETPECEACVTLRASSGGRDLWCAKHTRTRVPTSLWLRGDDLVPMGGLDPGLVP